MSALLHRNKTNILKKLFLFFLGKRSISDEEMAEFMAENEAAESRYFFIISLGPEFRKHL